MHIVTSQATQHPSSCAAAFYPQQQHRLWCIKPRPTPVGTAFVAPTTCKTLRLITVSSKAGLPGSTGEAPLQAAHGRVLHAAPPPRHALHRSPLLQCRPEQARQAVAAQHSRQQRAAPATSAHGRPPSDAMLPRQGHCCSAGQARRGRLSPYSTAGSRPQKASSDAAAA